MYKLTSTHEVLSKLKGITREFIHHVIPFIFAETNTFSWKHLSQNLQLIMVYLF